MYKAKEEKIIKSKQGITLIALVITIIILLILAGVTLNSAIGENGLFQRAKLATEKYQEAEANETASLAQLEKEISKVNIDYNDYVGAYVDYKPDEGSYAVESEISGAIAKQEFSTNNDSDMKWRIWDYDGQTIRLISEKPTNNKLGLNGVKGYNNGINILNEICRKCFGKNDTTGISVENLKKSDVQKVTTYDYTKIEGENTILYGSSKTYDKSKSYKVPIIWFNYDKLWTYEANENKIVNSIDKEAIIFEKEYDNINLDETVADVPENTVFKQSHWSRNFEKNGANSSDWVDVRYYDLIFGYDLYSTQGFGGSYWLGTRYCMLGNNNPCFGISRILAGKDGKLDNFGVRGCGFIENGLEDMHGGSLRLRPMVSIDLKLSKYALEPKEIVDGKVTEFELRENNS